MRILITGAYGQLGNEFNVLSEKFPQCEFLFTDVDSLNITDENAVNRFFIENKPEFVINCAAYTAVDKAETDVITARKVNATAPEILAKAAKNIGAKNIQISTDYVFNGEKNTPYEESDVVNPVGVYGQTKLEGENLSFQENPETIVIRTSWLYSTFGNNFVKTMLRLGKERDALNVVFDQVGTPTYAADLASAILQIVEISKTDSAKFVPGVYHFSNEGVASWFDFSTAIFEIANVKCKVSPVLSSEFPTPAKRPNYSVLNKSKIKNTFALQIPYWTDSLKKCITKLENIG